MTAGLMGPPPQDAVDPLAPQHVAPLVTYLASPAAAGINGEVFVVHGGVAAIMDPPRIRAVFLAADHGSPDGMWTPDSMHRALDPVFAAGLSPGDSSPGDSFPGDSFPGDSSPGDSSPGDSSPGDSSPGDSSPGDSPSAGPPPAGFACEDTLTIGFAGREQA
jgi:hypothetical protein